MRHWFLVLMIALLPLRGWVGDAMALDMLMQPPHSAMATPAHGAEHGAGSDHRHSAAAHSPSHLSAQGPCACDEAAVHDGTDHAHGACDVCNVPALAMAAAAMHRATVIPGPMAPPAERFASTEAQRGIKPPIS